MQQGVRLGILIGGPSPEYEVSRASAENILLAAEQLGYSTKPILVTPDQSWYAYTDRASYLANEYEEAFGVRDAVEKLPYLIDVALIAMHGVFGEDGGVQRLLDRAGLPYQGSGVRASKLTFDKHASSQVLRRAGFAVPDYTVIERAKWVVARPRIIRQAVAAYGLPVVVKPNASGSSIGVTIARDVSELTEALELTSAQHGQVIVQRFVRGHEVTCGILEQNGKTFALPPTLIRPLNHHFFDYKAKYSAGATEEITPAPFSEATNAAIGRTALGVHRALKLQGYSRVDMILAQRRLWVLEANTLPGMTNTSLLPQAAAAIGIDFVGLVSELVQHALTRPEVVELS